MNFFSINNWWMGWAFIFTASGLLAQGSTETQVEPETNSVAQTNSVKQELNEPFFGKYKIGIGFSRPLKLDIQDTYQEFYGNTNGFPLLEVQYFPFYLDYASLGLRGSFGYYTDSGFASKNPGGSPYERDENGRLDLSIIPFSLSLCAQTSPLRSKWIVLGAWYGLERVSYQEVRVVQSNSAIASSLYFADETSKSESTSSQKPYVNSGTSMGSTMGAFVQIRITPLQFGAANMMENTMGLREIYFTPYYESVKHNATRGVDFSRSAYGMAFVFESVY